MWLMLQKQERSTGGEGERVVQSNFALTSSFVPAVASYPNLSF